MVNPQSKRKLIRLARKVLNGQATPEEKAFLRQYYDYFDKNEVEVWELSSEEKDVLEDRMLHNVFEEADRVEMARGTRYLKNRTLRVAALVAVLIGLAGTFYIFYYDAGRNTQTDLTGTIAETDVPPGGNKAVLTLANGTQMILDSLSNGNLATQGNSSVIKLSNGHMAYRNRYGDPGQAGNSPDQAQSVVYNTLSTPRSGNYELTLPDGTRVWLNSSSAITFPTTFAEKERRVRLEGEAYFEVSKNHSRPFVVETNDIEIRDIGTHFDVMAYADEPATRATLVEGAIEVVKGAFSVLLKPGEQSIIANEANSRIVVAPADTNAAVAWKNGYFSFNHTSIYEIMRQVSRWYDVDVNYGDSLGVSLNGHISRRVPASEVFKILELTGDLNFSIKGKVVTVEKRILN